MMRAITGNEHPFCVGVPKDPDDFGRCYRLLLFIPEWLPRLEEMSAQFPEWTGLVREWEELTHLYNNDHDKLYERLQVLRDEGLRADGWIDWYWRLERK